MQQIISCLSTEIKQKFTNDEIYDLFKNDKKILLNLYNNKVLIPDKSHFIKENKYENWVFFLHEIKTFSSDEEIQNILNDFSSPTESILNDFDHKREIGENDSYIAQLIRDDLVDDFISYITRTSTSLKSTRTN